MKTNHSEQIQRVSPHQCLHSKQSSHFHRYPSDSINPVHTSNRSNLPQEDIYNTFQQQQQQQHHHCCCPANFENKFRGNCFCDFASESNFEHHHQHRQLQSQMDYRQIDRPFSRRAIINKAISAEEADLMMDYDSDNPHHHHHQRHPQHHQHHPLERYTSKQRLVNHTKAHPVSISRRQILSKLNGDNEFGNIGQLHCSTILRRAQSQPTFGQYGGSEETNDFDDEIDEIDDDEEEEEEEEEEAELFEEFDIESELNADLNGNFKQLNMNSAGQKHQHQPKQRPDLNRIDDNRRNVFTNQEKSVLSNNDHNNQSIFPINRISDRQSLLLLNNNGRGSTGASLTCSSSSSESSHRSANTDLPLSIVEHTTNSSSMFLPARQQATKKKPMMMMMTTTTTGRKTVASTLGRKNGPKTNPTNEEKHLMNAFERSLANLDPNLIQADVLQSEIYNSEHSARISQLKEITNLANNQVVLSGQDEDGDTWYNKRRLYDDHIAEIVDKWTQLDNEIWCKVICLERNRRVAKAYIRLPYLIVTGAETGFDGYTIGLSGFENPHRDQETKYIVKNLEKGVRIKMDECGNLIMRRMCSATVQIKDWLQQLTEGVGALGEEVIALHGRLPLDRAVKVFDMQRFERNLQTEMAKKRPDTKKLADQCILPIAFGKNTFNTLNSPCWLMSINVIALRMIFQAFAVKIPDPDYGETTEGEERQEDQNEQKEEEKSIKKAAKEEEEEQSGQASDEAAHIYSSI